MKKRRMIMSLLLICVMSVGLMGNVFAAPSSWGSFPAQYKGNPNPNSRYITAMQMCLYDSHQSVRNTAVNRGYSSKLAFSDGSFGSATEAVVECFQSVHRDKLDIDGSCGPKTWPVLQEVNSIAYHTPESYDTYKVFHLGGPLSVTGNTWDINIIKTRRNDGYVIKWEYFRNRQRYLLN